MAKKRQKIFSAMKSWCSFRLVCTRAPHSLGTRRAAKKTLLRNKSSLDVCSIIDSAERVNFSCITYPRWSGREAVTNMWNVCDNAWSLNLIAQSRRRRRGRTWHGAASGAIHLNSRPYLLSFRALRGRKINKQKWKMSFMWLIILNGSVFILIILSSFCLVCRNWRGKPRRKSAPKLWALLYRARYESMDEGLMGTQASDTSVEDEGD